MSTQVALSWGSLYLVSPSDGHSGYDVIDISPQKPDVKDIVIPNTAGRIRLVVGRGQSDKTARRVSFDCECCYSSAANLIAFIGDVQSAMTSTSQGLRTLSYGLKNAQATFTDSNMEFTDFQFNEIWVDAAGNYWLKFKALFSQYGA